MRRVRTLHPVFFQVIMLCLTACATVPSDIEPPKIGIANIAQRCCGF